MAHGLTANDLKEIKMKSNFQRGQVYKNPEDDIAMIIRVVIKDNDEKIEYVTEHGEFGSFYKSDKAMTDNIEEVN